MKYILCQFDSEELFPGIQHSGQFYQQIDENQNLINYLNLDGSILELISPYGYSIIDTNPTLPIWV
jgi:hypothetical protein